MFNNCYKNKKVLVTGHSGFKGSWLTLWLLRLGARVVGYSSYLPSTPCNFTVCDLRRRITHIEGDVRDFNLLKDIFLKYSPEMVFHLAAQPIVLQSYDNPKITFDTNVGGTINVLECIRTTKSVNSAVIITSDKCYRNMEWTWGYREDDRLGGEDPYSSSKACAELVCYSYIKSFFVQKQSLTRVATARAGNVIGGGDWAENRVVPDCVRAWSKKKKVIVRNPGSTRPWQHLLEPLGGYLWLGACLLENIKLHGEAFNFGPDQKISNTVERLIRDFRLYWDNAEYKNKQSPLKEKENALLKLNCDKALHLLNWHAALSFEETVKMTAEWYKAYYSDKIDMFLFSINQIEEYYQKATAQGLVWAQKQ
jgi:CDP-glucose 4,6-dehydratase